MKLITSTLTCLMVIFSIGITYAQVQIVPQGSNPYSTCIPADNTNGPFGYTLINTSGTSGYVWFVKGDLDIDNSSGVDVEIISEATNPSRVNVPYGKGRLCVTYYDSTRSGPCGDPIVCYDIYKIFEDHNDNIVGPRCINSGDTVTYSINALVSVNLNAEIGIDQYYWDGTSGLIDEILYYSGDSSSITFVAGTLTGTDTIFVDIGQCNLSDGYRYALPIGQSIDSLDFLVGYEPTACLPFNTSSYELAFNPQSGVTYTWEVLGSWGYVPPLTGSSLTLLPDNSDAVIRITAMNDCATKIFEYRISRSLTASNTIDGDTCLHDGDTVQFSVNGLPGGVQMSWEVVGADWQIVPGQQFSSTPNIIVGSETGLVIAHTFNCPTPADTLEIEIAPETPGPITGDTCLTYGSTGAQVYSVPTVDHADSYEWFYPSGWTTTGATDEESITLNPDGVTPGRVGVLAVGCNKSDTAFVYVGYNSQVPDTILASEDCINAGMLDTIVFNVGTPVAGETYEWDIPNNFGDILNYQSTTDSSEVEVKTAGNDGTFIIRVRSKTSCGVSDWDTLEFTVDSLAFEIDTVELFPGFYSFAVDPTPVTGGTYYQWYKDGTPSSGGASQFGIVVMESEFPIEVCVDVTSADGCVTRDCISVSSSMMKQSDQFYANLEKLSEDDFSIYPNPGKDKVYLKTEISGNYELLLINSSGQVVLNDKMVTSKHRIDVEQLPTGNYYIAIRSQTGYLVKSIIISH